MRLLLLLVGCWLVAPVLGQSAQLSGTVVDAGTAEPLVGAHVVLTRADRTLGTAADLDGAFLFDKLAAGTYRISVTYVGYLPLAEENIVLAAGDAHVIDLRLDPSEIQVNPITITGSRRPEKLLESPSSITVLEPRQMEARTALTAAEHLKDAPSIDMISTGLTSSRVVIRGFNDNLASTLLTLVDNRIAQAPSVRLTALQLIPISSGDIERIEIVSGPASALYGPNAANGVVHLFTPSPFDSRGTNFSLAGGEQDVLLGSIRHAGVYGHRIGYKFSAQYYTGTDYRYYDPVELSARTAAITGGASADTLLVGARNFDVENIAFNGRVDFRIQPGTTLIVNAGLTKGSNIEITPTGAAQVDGARLGYAQIRLLHKDLFIQAYGNLLDSGNSYFLRTGEQFKDQSQLWVAQAQHRLEIGNRQRFTYGTDVFYTLPQGEGTVNGRNERNDESLEVGAYVQSETDLSAKLALTLAARIDHHQQLDHLNFSPRAALVFRPRPAHNFRLTYNRAFRTPTTNDLFADLVGLRDAFTLGQLEPVLGFAPTTDLRVQGMQHGFHFSRGAGGLPQFRSPFAPLAGLTTDTYIDLHNSAFTAVMWDVARYSSVAGLASNLADVGLLEAGDVGPVSAALESLLPAQLDGVRNALMTLDLTTQVFEPVADVSDFSKLDVTRTETIELGYKGLIGRGLIVGVDAYYTRIQNFVGPFVVGTPNVFLDPGTLNTALRNSLVAAVADPANASAADALRALDTIPFIGNQNGSGAEEAATLISTQLAAAIPFGTVSPTEAYDPTALILMRRNFGDISVYGVDLQATMFLSRRMRIGGLFAAVSDNYFPNVDNVDDIALNAPRFKIGGMVQYGTPDGDFEVQVRGRLVDGFPVKSDVYTGQVERFGVLDASLNYRMPFSQGTRMTLTVQNLTNNKHREFVDVPEIGRLAMVRLSHDF